MLGCANVKTYPNFYDLVEGEHGRSSYAGTSECGEVRWTDVHTKAGFAYNCYARLWPPLEAVLESTRCLSLDPSAIATL